ncbi:MAG: hypothetical protein KDA93_26740 [Planctomycetaceae bacterium]|nr:hypothetical protein [Planctomycetaceae bacterium]
MFDRRKLMSVGLVTASIGCVFCLPATKCPAADLGEIATAYERQDATLESLYVKHSMSTEAIGTPADIHKYLGVEWLAESTRAFAFKGRMRYSLSQTAGTYEHIVDVDEEGNPEMVRVTPGLEQTFNGEAYFQHDGKEKYREHPAAVIETREERLKEPTVGQFHCSYLEANFRTLPNIFGEQDRCDASVRCLAESGACRVLPETAIVSETECVVLTWERTVEWNLVGGSTRQERMLNKLYCDPQRNFAMVQYELFNVLDEPVLRSRTTSSDFVEVADGVWLPQTMISESCAPPQDVPDSLRGVALLRTRYEVSEIHANDVPDELFTPEINTGTWVHDSRHLKDGEPIQYVIPDDSSQLASVMQEAIATGYSIPNSTKPQPSPMNVLPDPMPDRGDSSSNSWRIFILINVLVLIGAAVWFVKRRA